jgi:hypothetical protein
VCRASGHANTNGLCWAELYVNGSPTTVRSQHYLGAGFASAVRVTDDHNTFPVATYVVARGAWPAATTVTLSLVFGGSGFVADGSDFCSIHALEIYQ